MARINDSGSPLGTNLEEMGCGLRQPDHEVDYDAQNYSWYPDQTKLSAKPKHILEVKSDPITHSLSGTTSKRTRDKSHVTGEYSPSARSLRNSSRIDTRFCKADSAENASREPRKNNEPTRL
jgi:hypothetical protein